MTTNTGLPEPTSNAGKWAVMVNKPETIGVGIYNYYDKRGDAERVAVAVDGWVLPNGIQAKAVSERLILFPEKDHGSRKSH